MKKNKIVYLSLITTLLLFFLTACNNGSIKESVSNNSAQVSDTKKAQNDLKEKDPKTRKQFEKLVKDLNQKRDNNPKNEDITYRLAEAEFSLGNFSSASTLLNDLMEKDNPRPDALYLSAQIDYLEGRYDTSEEKYTQLLKEHKEQFGLQAESGLQMVYYQTNQYEKAKNLFKDQAGMENPILDMMKSFGNSKPYEIDWKGKDFTSIPFINTPIGVFVPIEVNGIKMNAFVDTGGNGLSVDKNKAEELGINSASETQGEFAGGKTGTIGFGKTEKLKLGDVEIKNVPTMLGSFDAWKDVAGFKEAGNVHAVVGLNVLQQFISTINFPERKLDLVQRNTTGQTKVEDNQKNDIVEAKIPFTLAGTHYLHAKGKIKNSDGLNMFIDSGFISEEKAGVNLSKETMNLTKIPMPKMKDSKVSGMGGGDFKEGQFDISSYGLKELETKNGIGHYETGEVLDSMFDATGFVTDAMIGENYVKNYKWTIDFDKMTMTFSSVS